ncbi:MAG TPA: hypothetical protein VEK11_23975 [Thermoanaerobaculia bacterium]|nr:hypothetical protein [Thermoanaerobaculia bacterium]
MRSRSSSLLLALLALASPLFARVISYAPYTNREARTGVHERNTRYFVLLEERSVNFGDADVVVYDASGREEPRVVFPSPTSGPNGILAVAMHEDDDNVSLVVFVSSPRHTAFFSADGGTTWKEVTALRDKFVLPDEFSIDTGGPWVGGLGQIVRIGDSANPFYFSVYDQGIWTLDANGNAKRIESPSGAWLAGQDRAGQRFLYTTLVGQAGPGMLRQVRLMDRNGNSERVADVTPSTHVMGWITGSGDAYLVFTRQEGRFLYHWRSNGDLRFVNGPDGIKPPPLTTGTVGFSPRSFIAVPTHDFNGAWMVQRGPGDPTTLFRHDAAGLEQMWRDVSGPEVEALIAGDSGQTVLVQVHRDRSLQLQRPFIDPALAIWRVGEPAPRTYDELYLNEEANKGFVNLDVDAMAQGAPFVFNSGSMQMVEEGPISPPVGGGGDVIQEWGVVRASLKQHLVLPGVARLRGAFDSHWLTDVTMYNPLDEPQAVEVQYVTLGDTMQNRRTTQVTLAANEIRYVPDALKALFNVEDGGGTLHFIPAEGINVTGRTYNRKGNGTYGFGMQGIDYFNAAGPRFPMTFAGAFPGDHFRTNVLLTDTSGRGSEAMINAYGVSGPMGQSTATISAPAGGTLQMNAVSQPIGLLAREYGGLVVQPTRGLGIPTVVAIDNRTNDPTYFPPDIPATIPRTIPVIGHLDGVNDSRFRSDLYLFNPTMQTRTVVLEATHWTTRQSRQTQFTLLPREARVIADALPTLFQMDGLARLRFVSNETGEGVRATSRTYTIEANGATYGSLIPPLNNFQIGTPGDTLEILGASGGAGFRTNIGLVELSPMRNFAPTRVRIRLIDNTGKQLDTFTVEVPNAGGMQINDVFSARGITPPAASLIKVDVLDTGLIGAYATLTDNVTNDTTYLGAQLGAQPN